MTTIDTSGEAVASYTSNLTGETFTVWPYDDGYLIMSSNPSRHTERTPYPTKDAALGVLDRWRRMFEGDPEILGTPPEGHVTLRAYLDAGCSPAEHPNVDLLIEDLLGRDQGYRLAYARQIVATGNADPTSLVVPLTADDRTADDLLAVARKALTSGWWSLEIITDDEVAARFEAGLSPEQTATVAEGRAYAALEAEAERRPFVAELVTIEEPYRCGISGETCTGEALVLRASVADSWVADETRQIADRLVFSPAALRAVLDAEAAS